MLEIVVIQDMNDGRLAMSQQVAKKLASEYLQITIVSKHNIDQFSEIKHVSTTKDFNEIKKANILITTVVPKDLKIIDLLPKGCLIVAQNLQIPDPSLINQIKERGLKFLALNQIPRITRAQTMDVLSSQSNISGYRAVIEALYEYERVCPMMTTAAGTLKPAKILILGAGVAGLQAIATGKRMGAIVSAFDVRAAAKEQVESLGAKFIEVDNNESLETTGGYAKETSDEYKKKQSEKLEHELSLSGIVISTAQIPNKPAPRLITSKMIQLMKRGSVIVDLAVESGGNCEESVMNKVITTSNGVKIIGYRNLAERIPEDASNLFAQNVFSLLKLLIVDNKLVLNLEDEIIKSALIVD